MRYLVPLLMALLLTQCRTYYSIFGEESTFFSRGEKAILEKTTSSIDFDYGYDPGIELDYIFSQHQGFSNASVDARNLARALNDFNGEDLISFNEKIYRLKIITLYKMRYCRDNRFWKDYTYIKKYLLPPLVLYTDAVEKIVLSKEPQYRETIDKRKKVLDREIIKEMRRKEFEKLWEKDYDS